jgi:hypothetical protein
MNILIKRGSTTVLTVKPQQASTYLRAIMGDETVTLVWEQAMFTALQVGDYITYNGIKHTLNQLPAVKKISTHFFQYNAVFQSPIYDLLKAGYMLFDNTSTPPQAEFPLTGTPLTFMTLLVANLNRVAGSVVWSVGSVLTADVQTLSFSNESCYAVLQKLATAFKTEYSASGTTLNLIEISSVSNLTLEYASTLYDIERKTIDSSSVITRLYPFGSTRNIASNYRSGSARLLLPDNVPYLEANVNLYGVIEGQQTFEDVYPRLGAGSAGAVTSIGGDIFTFSDSNLDFYLNDCLMPGTPAKLRFLTGDCAGYDLEIASFNNSTKTFVVIVNNDDKGFKIPDGLLVPAVGNKYILLDIIMPDEYVIAAEAELQTKAQEYLDENSHPKVSYLVTFSEIYAKINSVDVFPGNMVTVNDTDIAINTQLRVVKVQKGVIDPWNIKIDLSDTVSQSTLTRLAADIAANTEGITEINKGVSQQFGRNWRNVQELSTMIDTLRSDMLFIGNVQGQFDITGTLFTPNYQNDKNKFYATPGSLIHKTIPTETPGTWTLPDYAPTLTGDSTPYYLYAKCSRSAGTGVYYTSASALAYDSDPAYYYFLVGVLSSVVSGVRTLQTTYGFTQITGKQVVTGAIQSNDGSTYFNLDTSVIGGNIKFKSGDDYIEVGAGIDDAINKVQVGGRNLVQNSDFTKGTTIAEGFEIYDNRTGLDPATATVITSGGVDNGSYQQINWDDDHPAPVGIYGRLVENWKPNTEYVISFWAKGASPAPFQLFLGWDIAPAIVTAIKNSAITSGWQQYIFKIKWGSGVETEGHFYLSATYGVDGGNIDFDKLKIEIGNKATDWSPAPEDIDAAITAVAGDLSDLSGTLSNFQTEVNGDFKDGLIETSEAKSIAKYINTITTEKADIDNQYTIVYGDANLLGLAKSNLLSAKSAYNSAHTNLINSINTAIADGKTTPTESADVTAKFTLYSNALVLLSTRFIAADTAIKDARAQAAIVANNEEYIEDIRADLQGQIDGQLISWFYQVDPTINNTPAVGWTTPALKLQHSNDTYTNTNTGGCWRWQQVGGVWDWGVIADTATQQALIAAGNAQDTADGKRTVFTTQPTTPYKVGDLWLTSLTSASGDLKKCITEKLTGIYEPAHWVLATKYTDDSALDDTVVGGANLIENSNFADQFAGWTRGGTNGATKILPSFVDTNTPIAFFDGVGAYTDAFLYRDLSSMFDKLSVFELVFSIDYYQYYNDSNLVIYFSGVSQEMTCVDNNFYRTWKRYTMKLTSVTPIKSLGLSIYGDATHNANGYITNLSLQIGNKATSWKPSTQYLADALKSTLDVYGGLAIGNILAVKNRDGVVVGGMNGGETADNDIRLWFGEIISEMDDAPFKIYEDGTIELSNEKELQKLQIGKSPIPSLATIRYAPRTNVNLGTLPLIDDFTGEGGSFPPSSECFARLSLFRV